MTARFAPAEIGADISQLPDNERRALAKLVDAARLMDSLFLRQVWSGNDALLQRLAREVGTNSTDTGAAERLHYFLINKAPWSRLDHNKPFIPGVPEKPEGANFYPAGATKAEIEQWLASLTGPAKTAATGFFTTIRRAPDGKVVAVPYSVEYQGELALAASLLREAAQLTSQPTLKTYLDSRADAFISNDYYASDVAWMELDARSITIGPYEVYEDELFNFKAAFEAFVTVRDAAETKKLDVFGPELQGLENALPIDPKYRNPTLGALVADSRRERRLHRRGRQQWRADRGVQPAERRTGGQRKRLSKRVMLKNVQEAKFRMVLLPISRVVLPAAQQKNVSFDAFFTHILMHELMHGLGPHNIIVNGQSDDRPSGAQGNLQRDRRSEGRRLRTVGVEAARGPGEDRCRDCAHDVHDVPRVGCSDRSGSASTKRTDAASQSR